jgi:3-deoxy-D-manno-octulosonic acid kinase
MQWIQKYGADPVLAAFSVLRDASVRGLVRRGYEVSAREAVHPNGELRTVAYVGGGRERHAVVELESGERALVRRYRRGGVLRRINHGTYFVGNRALAELRVTEAAAQRGVRVPHVIAGVERRAGIGYTATLLVRWIPEAHDLATWLDNAAPTDRLEVLRLAGNEIGKMHAAGIGHADLNLRNLVVASRDGGEGREVYIIDFDRGRIYDADVPVTRRRRDLLRLARSVRKLSAPVEPEGWSALRQGYGSAWPLSGRLG